MVNLRISHKEMGRDLLKLEKKRTRNAQKLSKTYNLIISFFFYPSFS